MGSMNLISLNIERSKHLERVIPFLIEQEPDVFCVQELSERDYGLIESKFKYSTPFVPFSHYVEHEEGAPQGICIFSNIPIVEHQIRYYYGDPTLLPTVTLGKPQTYLIGNRALLVGTFEKDGAEYKIGTTHFTWSERGEANDRQRQDLQSLLSALETETEIILCGDFNMPRGGELFSILAEKYKDNIPSEYKTSIDIGLHRNRVDNSAELATKMVDGLFTTPAYTAHDVTLVSSVSDHMAIVATVEKS